MKLHRIRIICRAVERIKLKRQFAIAEVGTEEIAGFEQRGPAAVTWIAREALIVADDATRLTALQIASERRARRNADRAVEGDSILHEDVQDSRGEESTHRPALEYQSRFHLQIHRQIYGLNA